MWVLTLITIINGGATPSKFDVEYYHTREECIRVQHVKETEVRYGYCNWRGR